LDSFSASHPKISSNRELLAAVARTSVHTKLEPRLADIMTDIVTDAVLTVYKPGLPLDLHMIERMHMLHQDAANTRLVKGLVMDHGARHPDMPKYLENCYVLTCNVSLEYEKTEFDAGFEFSSAEQREKMVESERTMTDEKVMQLIDLKRQVCTPENGYNFVVINQKGIDPLSLDMMAKENIIGLRRAKRRNMERVTLACGGVPVNSFDDLTPDVLGWAGKVWEETLGETKYTFMEDVKDPHACTVLLKGPNPHTIAQLKDAVRDGTRAVANAIEDLRVVPGAGAFEIAAAESLYAFQKTVSGKAKVGVKAFADALLVIPKTLAANSGFDVMDTIIKLQEERASSGAAIGLDVESGDPILPESEGIWDNYRVKRQFLQLSTVIASQLLLVDEVMRAGRKMGNKG